MQSLKVSVPAIEVLSEQTGLLGPDERRSMPEAGDRFRFNGKRQKHLGRRTPHRSGEAWGSWRGETARIQDPNQVASTSNDLVVTDLCMREGNSTSDHLAPSY
jgi:hypothetical protein